MLRVSISSTDASLILRWGAPEQVGHIVLVTSIGRTGAGWPNRVLAINEARDAQSLPPVPWGDKPWLPDNQLQPK
jgi:hypothetical protein